MEVSSTATDIEARRCTVFEVRMEAGVSASQNRTRLVAGPGAFVMEVEGFAGFASAVERKLLREITPEPLAALPSAPGP